MTFGRGSLPAMQIESSLPIRLAQPVTGSDTVLQEACPIASARTKKRAGTWGPPR